jgi:serine/threonine-protein kinase
MPSPATTEQLLTNLRKSGLVPPERLEGIQAVQSDSTPAAVLDQLVDSQLLTRYQADKLAAGKYRGFTLGPYVILDRLGGGGMGHVFLAEHSAMKRTVALKVLSIDAACDEIARERFHREARVAAGLDHPNIARVFDLRNEDKIFYMVMEHIDGDSLQHIVARHGPLPWQTAVHYAWQIALGLQHAHENNLVHRDIKPANLLLTRDGVVKIIDLGLVRWEEEASSKLTEKVDKSILGTADYLAPEQAVNSSTVDIRADIYSLGATLYFLLAGRTIFPEGKTAQKLMWQQMKAPTPIRDLVPDLPAPVAAILHRCLSKSPADRCATPVELAHLLAPWCQQLPPLPEAKWFPLPRRKGLSAKSTIGPSPFEDVTPVPRRVGTDSRELLLGGHLVAPRIAADGPTAASLLTLPDSATDTPRELPNVAIPKLLTNEPAAVIIAPGNVWKWIALAAIGLLLVSLGAVAALLLNRP